MLKVFNSFILELLQFKVMVFSDLIYVNLRIKNEI